MNNEISGSFVFVITYARSRSTLLTAILNTIRGYDIRGENGNALFHLWKGLTVLKHAEKQHGDLGRDRRSPWFGCHQYDLGIFEADCVRSFADNVLTKSADALVRGFKEIRYTREDMTDDEFDGFMTFLLEAFPDSRLVFNRRNPESVSRSRYWASWPAEEVISFVEDADARFARTAARCNRAFSVDYESYTGNPGSLSLLFDFLGQDLDIDKVQGVLKTRFTH